MRSLTNNKPSTANGMTLIEIMVTLSIVAIVVGLLAAGDFSKLLYSTWGWSSESTLVGCIQLAKSEAVTRNTEVGLCAKHAETETCSGAGDNDWKNGCLVFTNPDADGKFTTGSSKVIRVGDKLARAQEISAPSYAFVFFPDGTIEGRAAP